jgi:hypothetical protein
MPTTLPPTTLTAITPQTSAADIANLIVLIAGIGMVASGALLCSFPTILYAADSLLMLGSAAICRFACRSLVNSSITPHHNSFALFCQDLTELEFKNNNNSIALQAAYESMIKYTDLTITAAFIKELKKLKSLAITLDTESMQAMAIQATIQHSLELALEVGHSNDNGQNAAKLYAVYGTVSAMSSYAEDMNNSDKLQKLINTTTTMHSHFNKKENRLMNAIVGAFLILAVTALFTATAITLPLFTSLLLTPLILNTLLLAASVILSATGINLLVNSLIPLPSMHGQEPAKKIYQQVNQLNSFFKKNNPPAPVAQEGQLRGRMCRQHF